MTVQTPYDPSWILADWVLPIDGPPIRNGFIHTRANRLVAVGRQDELPQAVREAARQLPNTLLAPGFINLHTHLEQTFEAPISCKIPERFDDWLTEVVHTLRNASSTEEKLSRSRKGAHQLLASGVTCVNDIASGGESLQALAEAGLRGRVSLELVHPWAEATPMLTAFIERYLALSAQVGENTYLEVGFSPHSPYNVSVNAWKTVLETCQPSFIHTHGAEFQDEVSYLQGKPDTAIHRLHQALLENTFQTARSETPIVYLYEQQLLNLPTVIAHAVHTTETDRDLLTNLPVGIAHCPRSNLCLHQKTLNFQDWQQRSIPMGLGTDGRLSTPDLDIRAEARQAMATHSLSAQTVVEMLTIHGTRALGLEDEIGSLTVGKKADLGLWQAPGPISDSYAALLDPKTRLSGLWIDGVNRMEAVPI